MKQYLIIGNGAAAAACIEGIRSQDHEGAITVVSAEKHPVYCRPLISYYLEGRTDRQKMNYRPVDFYEKNGCRVLYGETAEALDAAAKTVTLSGGEVLDYDALCIASGAHTVVRQYPGLDTVEQKFTFLTLDDALALEQAVTAGSRVLILGAGLIGLKCAEGLAKRVASVTVVNRGKQLLGKILDEETAALVQQRMEENGVQFCLGRLPERFDGHTVTLTDGATLEFDVLVMAQGVAPNTELLAAAGGKVEQGICIDDHMRTSLPDVYAAGDCVESEDISGGARRNLAILPNANLQGRCAGVNMAGGEAAFSSAMPLNALGFFGLHTVTAGTYFAPEEGGEVYEVRENGSVKKLFTRDNRLTGFILLGDVERAGIYTALIRNQTPLDSIDFDAVKKSPSLLPFGQNYRSEKLGGVV